ncbi:MAG TPA: hypothetical protein VLG92_00940 [Candidatus Saccharimonadia bacterium]|nr:hypothetical protein [Candidatus Saccharimonadia bacterium]
MKKLTIRIFSLTLLGLLVVSILIPAQQNVSAAYAPDFQAGNIIGDSQFFDSGAMNADQIQAFLTSQVPNCDTWGTQTSEYGGGTRAQYGAARGYPAPYICLKNYIENPTTHANNLGGVAPDGGWSAAQIIANAAVSYGVNPKALLVTIQKESALVNDTWPFPSQYKTAMGYGCPDSAPCDSQYYGFFNQVTNAARQFHQYATNPASYRYKAGQTNAILYSPNASCGSSGVFLQNQATAGLYNYTPYQPDPAALSNLYGNTGDSCSSFGNRNFWRLYTDWFGSTSGSDLVRTVNDATVYLVSGANKYPIADGNLLNDFSPIGKQVQFVSDAFMSSHTTGPLLGHMVGSPGGTLYFVNAGIKLPFTSCDQVVAYGYSCGAVNYLTDGQLGNLASGPAMTSLYKTTSGKEFYIVGGTKREVFDQQSLTAANISDGANMLLEGGLAYLAYGPPVIRADVLVGDRGTGQQFVYSNATYLPVQSSIANLTYISGLPNALLDDTSIPVGQRTANASGFISDPTGAAKYILMNSGKVQLTNPSAWNVSYSPVSTNLLSTIPNATDPINNQLLKSSNDATVYYVTGGQKRPISSWADLVGLNVTPFAINVIPTSELNAITTGKVIFASGRLVKSVTSATVYVTESNNTLLPITSFVFPQDMGIPLSVATMPDSDLQSYTIANAVRTEISCSGVNYVGVDGKLYVVDSTAMTTYGLNPSDFLDTGTMCDNLSKSTQPLGLFVHVGTGTIYYVSGGSKRAIVGYNTYLAHGGNSSNTLLSSDYFASLIPTGQNLTQ